MATQRGILYKLGKSCYISLTNQSNAMPLVATRGPGFLMPPESGFKMLDWEDEPNADDVITELMEDGGVFSKSVAPRKYESIVFAGPGEPTMRFENLIEIAEKIREETEENPIKLRLHTNGLGNYENKRNIIPELKGLIDGVTVSLNTSDEVQYNLLMHPQIEGNTNSTAFEMVQDFVRSCVENDLETECTVVERNDVDMEAAKDLIIALGAKFRSRTYHP